MVHIPSRAYGCTLSVSQLLPLMICAGLVASAAEPFPKPFNAPRTQRADTFAFTRKPTVRYLGHDKFEIDFAVQGYCDVTVSVIDKKGFVVRHVASGVLGTNAPPPFQRNSLEQKIHWRGKDDFGEYIKKPEKFRLRVQLGLKPTFHKRLGGTSGKNFPGYVFGMALDEKAAYVFIKGPGSHGHVNCRVFDRDGKYQRSLVPPPANLPKEKLGGMALIEYEQGVETVHGPSVFETVSRNGFILPDVNGKGIASCQPALIGNKLFFSNAGSNLLSGRKPSKLYYIHTDGSTNLEGIRGLDLGAGAHLNPRLATSPDGKWIYLVGSGHAVWRRASSGEEKAKPFIGNVKKPGSDNKHLNEPLDVTCDAAGRLYVVDGKNNRVQIFAPDGNYLKSIQADRPVLVRTHLKSGAIYIKHSARVKGKTINRLTKFHSFDKPTEAFHMDDYPAALMAVDHWSAKPRLWLAGSTWSSNTAGAKGSGPSVTIWEEHSKGWKKIADFEAEAKKEAGKNYMGRWSGNGASDAKLACDGLRERVYFKKHHIFDLHTGQRIGRAKFPFATDDVTFDKRGFAHLHFNPGFYTPGVARQDPSRPQKDKDGVESYPEVPYDYGIERTAKWNQQWKGIIAVKDQPGAKFFQDGIGVSMRGDVATESNIYYVPKMEDIGVKLARAGIDAQLKAGQYYDGNQAARFERHIADLKKRGEDIYSLKRRPGQPLAGGTVWTFHRTGELHKECAFIGGAIVNGVQIDEDYCVYTVNARPRVFDKRPFLFGQGRTIGDAKDKGNRNPFTGVLIKTKPDAYCSVTLASAPIPMNPLPTRPPDVIAMSWPNAFSGNGNWGWIEGYEWLYAGASPIVSVGCSCPKQMLHTDWFKRTFVPEAYRHSIGVLDTAGNLILHIGRYGNFDSGMGAKSKIRVGGDEIGCYTPRFISGTDNYLVFEDRGERLQVLKLDYHAEEILEIKTK